MAEHIDRTRLAKDLRYHFDYLSKFLNFTTEDVHILNALAPMLFPCISYIVDTVYTKLYAFDITRQYFNIFTNEFQKVSSKEDMMPAIVASQSDLLKETLSVYIKRLLIQAEWNDGFLQYLSELPGFYKQQQKINGIDVDSMAFTTMLGYLKHTMIDVIWRLEHYDTKKKRSAIRAINKCFWIQSSFSARHYKILLKENSVSQSMNGKDDL